MATSARARITFAQGFYLALKGELPDEKTGRMIDAILVSSIDHGATPPSALTARMVAATGAPLSSAVAAGTLAISRLHGGAIENGMVQMREVAARADAEVRQAVARELEEAQYAASLAERRYEAVDPTKRLGCPAASLGVGPCPRRAGDRRRW